MHLFDSNVFMEASRLYYSFGIAPGYWQWLIAKALTGEIGSVGAVYDEIAAGAGDLVTWADDPGLSDFWLPDTTDSLSAIGALATWANDPAPPFKQSAVDEFMDSADLRLVAQASAIGATIVTRETSDPQCKKRVKIPDAASAVGVQCVQPFIAYQQLGLSLT